MKIKTISLVTFALVVGVVILALQINEVYADTSWSNSTLNGRYGFFATGVNTEGPYAAVGTLTFDGKENVVRRQGVSRNGAFEKNHAFFKYEVASDCTGKMVGPNSGEEFEAFVVVNEGTEIYIIKESDQTVYIVAKKVHQ